VPKTNGKAFDGKMQRSIEKADNDLLKTNGRAFDSKMQRSTEKADNDLLRTNGRAFDGRMQHSTEHDIGADRKPHMGIGLLWTTRRQFCGASKMSCRVLLE
jgi:hypothetical protein